MRKGGSSMAQSRMVILSGKDVHLLEDYQKKLMLVAVKEILQLHVELRVLVLEESIPKPVEKHRPTIQSSNNC